MCSFPISPTGPGVARLLRVALVAIASLAGVATGAATPELVEQAQIRQPGASFIDVAARMHLLRDGPGPLDTRLQEGMAELADCSSVQTLPPPERPMRIPPRYLNGNTGPLHPQYETAVALYRDFETHVARLANTYVATGRAGFATCLVEQLDRWAQAEALLDYTVSGGAGASKQAWYQVEWTASAAALALSQVMAEPTLNRARLARVLAWLQQVSTKQISDPGGVNTCCNNHAYWRGLHATMVGVLTGDLKLYCWGFGCYILAIDHLAANGSWPLEMARKELSMHYQNFALQPLVLIAEIAAQQGLDLYAYRSASGQDLHAAIGFLALNRAQPERWAALGLVPQETRGFAPGHGELSWAEFYRARFGRDPLGLLTQASFNARTGGNATMLAYRPAAMGVPPSARIDLGPWKLQLPDASASEVKPAQLVQGFRNEYFEVEPSGSLLFTAPVGGGTTTNAKYTRSELREMLDPNDRARNWTATGTHRMQLSQEVLQPPHSGRVVVFQIHAVQLDGSSAPPLVKAQWHDGRMEFLVKLRAQGGEDRIYVVPKVPLKRRYDASLEVRDGRLIMEINGTRFEDDFVQRDAGWQQLRYYFKAGNYPQDKDRAEGNQSVVRIHKLKVSHE